MMDNKMPDLEWREAYSLNVPSIDNAHKEIFQITALLMEKNLEDNREAAIEGVEFLKNYVNGHFADEEKYMLEIAYPGYAAHCEEHAAFRDKTVPKIEERLKQSNYDKESVQEFIEILIDWLARHIMVHDKIINISKYI